jgi:hypothetical protein
MGHRIQAGREPSAEFGDAVCEGNPIGAHGANAPRRSHSGRETAIRRLLRRQADVYDLEHETAEKAVAQRLHLAANGGRHVPIAGPDRNRLARSPRSWAPVSLCVRARSAKPFSTASPRPRWPTAGLSMSRPTEGGTGFILDAALARGIQTRRVSQLRGSPRRWSASRPIFSGHALRHWPASTPVHSKGR